MFKSPISVLQELAVQRKLPLPEYEISGSGEPHLMSFTCNVNVGSESASGTGMTKKDAKHSAARNLLETLGVQMKNVGEVSNICLLPTKVRKEGPTINYIGRLNEFCSGRKFPQPDYKDSDTVKDTKFCITCRFLTYQAEGYGTTKKDAKQEAAKNMLLSLKDKDIGYAEVKEVSRVNVEASNADTEKVLQKYTDILKDLSINYKQPALNNNVELPKKPVHISTWDELVDYIHERGWNYKVTVFQHNPLILCLKINEYTLLNFGQTRDEIYKKFVVSVVEMLEKYADFSGPIM